MEHSSESNRALLALQSKPMHPSLTPFHAGATCRVSLATDCTGMMYAVKRLPMRFRRRAAQEMRIHAQMSHHPNIVPLISYVVATTVHDVLSLSRRYIVCLSIFGKTVK